MILAPMTEDRDEYLEAIDILIERVASNLDQLRQVVIRMLLIKALPLYRSASIIGVVKQKDEAERDSSTCYSFSCSVFRNRSIVCS